jgi:hypothetical protein
VHHCCGNWAMVTQPVVVSGHGDGCSAVRRVSVARPFLNSNCLQGEALSGDRRCGRASAARALYRRQPGRADRRALVVKAEDSEWFVTLGPGLPKLSPSNGMTDSGAACFGWTGKCYGTSPNTAPVRLSASLPWHTNPFSDMGQTVGDEQPCHWCFASCSVPPGGEAGRGHLLGGVQVAV